jgi:3-hydroxyacyl-[acyl-carrier-protein] dehydratase
MPLATFEGAIRVGQEKAALVEEITLTFGLADAVVVEPAKPAVADNEPAKPAVADNEPAPLPAAISA